MYMTQSQMPPAPRTPSNVVVVGITGGIACGKSTVSTRLGELGAVVINADSLGHEAYMPGTQCLKDMVAYFGEGILGSDGSVDRTKLGPLVFSEAAHMTKLNEIVWPCIEDIIRARVADLSAKHAKVSEYVCMCRVTVRIADDIARASARQNAEYC
jgi:phosphopantetheine adenylyltransferase/dephospho-CoA kinase